jgi:hypothetical protein
MLRRTYVFAARPRFLECGGAILHTADWTILYGGKSSS